MSDTSSNNGLKIGITVLVVAVIGGLLWFKYLRPPVENGPDNGKVAADNLTEEQTRQFIERKFAAIAQLENAINEDNIDLLTKSAGAFAKLAEDLPDDPLGRRNLVIARLLYLKLPAIQADPQKRAEAAGKVEQALSKLRAIDEESAVAHMLSGVLAEAVTDEHKAMEELTAAAELDPDNPQLQYRLYAVGRYSADAQIKKKAYDALARTHELKPKNLFVLLDCMLAQAEARDAKLEQTLTGAKESLQPFFKTVQTRHKIDLRQQIEEAIEAVKNDEWAVVLPMLRRLTNVIRPEYITQVDQKRIKAHLLEYLVHDFGPEFYKRADVPKPVSPEPIAVKLSPAVDIAQFPEVEKVRAVLLIDFDLNGRQDVIVARENKIEVYGRPDDKTSWSLMTGIELPGEIRGFIAADLDRDYQDDPAANQDAAVPESSSQENSPCSDADVDVVAYGPDGIYALRNKLDPDQGTRAFEPVPQEEAFDEIKGVRTAVFGDIDHEGDLDLIISSENGISIWANRGDFTFEDISGRSLLPPEDLKFAAILPVDWNRNVDLDLLLVGPDVGQAGYLENLLHGRFRWQEFDGDFDRLANSSAMAVAEVDGNVSWDLLTAGEKGISLTLTRNPQPAVMRFLKSSAVSESPAIGMRTWDFDNDGYLDILAWSETGIEVFRGTADGRFETTTELFESLPTAVQTCDVGDLDGDGDQDVVVATPDGVIWYVNEGGNQNNWIDVALRAEPNPTQHPGQRVNMHGIGSLLELKSGTRYQPQVVSRPTTHFGLGNRERADLIRVLWTSGVPHNIIKPQHKVPICEQQLLKGSCPYIYTWTGSQYEFLTDCLWAAPIGLQFAEGVTAPSRAWEYLKIPGERLVAKDGEYRLQITEELWEAAYFDTVQLMAVDHPAEFDIYTNEKVGPAELAAFKIHTVRNPRTPVAARDQTGRDVLPMVAQADGEFLRAFKTRKAQGVTEEHFLELDLGDLKDPERITLFLRAWNFPTDTSLNIAISQNPQMQPPQPPSLWVPDTDGGWKQAIPFLGFPGGKTKTMAVELTDIFPDGDYRLRIKTTMEIYWDAVFFSVDERAASVETQKLPLKAGHLHFRGFSKRTRGAGNGPEHYDYSTVSTEPLWPPMNGRFTRYGDVTGLVARKDDRLVVMGSGDELTLRFEVPKKKPPKGWKRDFILYNVGWDKDADLNTVYGQTVEPLPFGSMSGYPFSADESTPDSPGYRKYLLEYQTRLQNHPEFWRQVREFRSN